MASSICSLRPTYFTVIGLALGFIPVMTLYLMSGHFTHSKGLTNSPRHLQRSSLLQEENGAHRLLVKGPHQDDSEVVQTAVHTNGRRLFNRSRDTRRMDEKGDSKVKEKAPKVRGRDPVVQEKFSKDEEFSDVLSLESKPRNCEGELCLNFLSDSERQDFMRCLGNATKRQRRKMNGARKISLEDSVLHNGRSLQAGEEISCRFRDKRSHGPVGLVSFPGSGNTWVRQLLQMATGICTGSQYCDASLRLGGFYGEGVQSSSVLVIKSHSPKRTWTTELNQLERGGRKNRIRFDSVIFIIRNPYDALVAEWNRILSSKYGLGSKFGSQHIDPGYGKEYFLDNPQWVKFVRNHIAQWRKGFEWVLDTPPGHRLLVVTFEELKENRLSVVHRMLDFLHYKITNNQLKRRLSSGADKFKRPKTKQFEHFTPKLKALINLVIHTIADFLDSKLNRTYGVENYVQI